MTKKTVKTKIVNCKTINEAKMLEEIRKLLNLTIEKFVSQMNWPNEKYYDYIKNGKRRPQDGKKQKSHPSIFKVFSGINYAIYKYEHWQENAGAITSIVINYLMPWNRQEN